MRKVILTCGPRGAGKTIFCKQIIKDRPEVVLIERDAVLRELFGSDCLDPYTGIQQYGLMVMMNRVDKILLKDQTMLILDCWNGHPTERKNMVKKLRSFGADMVDAWYFVTGEDVVVRQMQQKFQQDLKEGQLLDYDSVANSCRFDFRLYHSRPVEYDQGFDHIELIDPQQLTLFPYADLLL